MHNLPRFWSDPTRAARPNPWACKRVRNCAGIRRTKRPTNQCRTQLSLWEVGSQYLRPGNRAAVRVNPFRWAPERNKKPCAVCLVWIYAVIKTTAELLP